MKIQTMPLDRVNVIVEHLIMDGSREGIILGDELNVAMGASARRRAAREAGLHDGEYLVKWEINVSADTPRDAAVKALEIQRNPDSSAVVFEVDGETIDLFPDDGEDEEGPTYHGIVRYTHVRCGYTTRVRSEMEMLNDGDPACPVCSEECNPEDCSPWPCRWPYGEMVWENGDGTIVETYSNGGEVTRRQPVRTHVQIYKSWINGPEWWIVPRPNTGDVDGSDNLIVGFDTYQEALDAVTSGEMPALLSELCPANDGIAWRDRNDPIYQITTPKEGLRF
jgi:hypothetical protein